MVSSISGQCRQKKKQIGDLNYEKQLTISEVSKYMARGFRKNIIYPRVLNK